MFGVGEAQNVVNEFSVVFVVVELEVPIPAFCFPADKTQDRCQQSIVFVHYDHRLPESTWVVILLFVLSMSSISKFSPTAARRLSMRRCNEIWVRGYRRQAEFDPDGVNQRPVILFDESRYSGLHLAAALFVIWFGGSVLTQKRSSIYRVPSAAQFLRTAHIYTWDCIRVLGEFIYPPARWFWAGSQL